VRKLLLGTIVLMMGIYLSDCASPTIYVSPKFEEYKEVHKKVAILPFDVDIDSKKLPKDYTLEMAREAEKDEGYNIQRELYIRFLDRQQRGGYTVEFQDVDKTNALLAKANVKYADLGWHTKDEICRLLEVDAIISGTIHRERPMSTGAAIVTGVLFGFWGSTNKVDVKMNVHESLNGDLVWEYVHEASGSVGSSSEKLAESLMKNISKKFPYKQIKK